MLFNHYDTSRVYRDGQIILPQGNRAPVMGLVEAGRVEIFHKSEEGEETIYRVLGPNEAFGVDRLFSQAPRRTGVRALGKATVSVMDKRDFIRRTQSDPQLAYTVLQSVLQRIRQTGEKKRQRDAADPSDES